VSSRGGAADSVRVLGAVCGVASDGTVIDVPSASQRRLLGLLAIHAPRALRAEWLADVLDVSPGALRTTVARLRTTIGPEALRTSGSGYALVADVDAAGFARAVADAERADDRLAALEAALDRWTGPVLEEFQGEEWTRGEVARLTELHAACVDDHVDGLLTARRDTAAVAEAEAQIGRHPYRDRSRGLLIRALALAGRQADALRAFHDYRSLLVEEFGTEPSPEVARIEGRVATGWNGVDDDGHGAPPGALDIPLPALTSVPGAFVGRSAELEVLGSELAAAEGSGLRTVVVGGEAGMGKTTLLSQFAASASTGGATVLYGRCDQTGVPLEPFRSLLDRCVEFAPRDLLTAHVAACGGELLRICPRLGVRVPTTPAPTGSDDATERFLSFEAAADLLRRIAARRPLVLVLDDLQWAEPTALLLLRHLARQLVASPVLVLVSRRAPGEATSDHLQAAVAELDRGASRHLHLEGLDEAGLSHLVAAAAEGVADAELQRLTGRLRDDTAGNPLYASQLVRHWVDLGGAAGAPAVPGGLPSLIPPEGVPPSLREVIGSRVRALGGEASTVLAAASVLGPEFREDVLQETLDLPETAVVEALDSAVAAGLLVDVSSARRELRFVHGLVCSALYAGIGPSSRARHHERVVRALSKEGEPFHPEVVLQLARHSALAGLTDASLAWSTAAGDHAFAHLAPTEAAHHYRVALDAAEALHRPDAQRADLLVRLGHAQHRAGDPAAEATLLAGGELARACGDDGALVRAALVTDLSVPRLERLAKDNLDFVEAAVVAAGSSDTGTYARLLALLARCLTFTPEVERRMALAREALGLAADEDDPAVLAAVAPSALAALWAPGNERERAEWAAAAVVAAEASGDPLLRFRVNIAVRQVALESADPAMAAHALARMRADADHIGEPYLRWIMLICDAFEATMAGRLAEGEALATEMLELGIQIGAADAFGMYAVLYFAIGTFGGRHAELFPLVEQAQAANPGLLPFRLAYGIICASVDREDETADILREGMERGFDDLPVDFIWMTTVVGYAICALELDDRAAAAALVPLLEPHADEVSFNGVSSQGPVAAYVGKLDSLLGRHDEAERHLRVALATADAFGWTYHRATTLLALAQNRHLATGDLDDDGRSWLAEASELCRSHGFSIWIPRIDALAASLPAAAPPS